MRNLAGETDDLRSRRIMRRIAADYERLALRVRERPARRFLLPAGLERGTGFTAAHWKHVKPG
jgi:hypothetical protein